MRLSDLQPASGARKSRIRVGRGHGSGLVKTSGRGQKGQKARTGHKNVPAYFEGGQNRFSQRMPYLSGFKNPFRKEYIIVNLDELATVFGAGEAVTGAALAEKGLIRPRQATRLLKVLGDGNVRHALHVTAHKVSDSARAKIEAAGGSVTLIAMNPTKKTKRAKKDAAEATAATEATAPAAPAQ